MKRFLPLVFLPIFFCASWPAAASQGDNLFKAGIGLALPLTGDLEDVADTGLALQGQFLRYVQDTLAVGGELDFLFFGEESIGGVDYETDSIILQGVLRKDLGGPSGNIPYGVLGLGLANTEIDAKVPAPGLPFGASSSDDDTSLAFMFGGGIDIPLQGNASLGVNVRYQHLFFDIGSIERGGFLSLLGQIRW